MSTMIYGGREFERTAEVWTATDGSGTQVTLALGAPGGIKLRSVGIRISNINGPYVSDPNVHCTTYPDGTWGCWAVGSSPEYKP